VPLCFVSIGSNIERERNIGGALRALRVHFGPLLISAVYETRAVGFEGAPFYNLVVAFASHESARQTAAVLTNIEYAHGRTRDSARFGPRTLDLDLLCYGESVVAEEGLKLPRLGIEKYAFVLEPLAEIAPDLRHAETGRCYSELWKEFSGECTATKPRLDVDN